MKYKVGDKVKIKSLDWYNENKNKFGKVWTSGEQIPFDKCMSEWCGKMMTISHVRADHYTMVEDLMGYWTDEMFEDLVEEETKSEDGLLDEYEELTDRAFKGGYEKCKSDIELNGFQLPEGYIFKDDNGNVINATKIVLEKKKKEYPKTYEECAEIIAELTGSDCNPKGCMGYMSIQLTVFQKLLICRDAYWKFYGDEMGLEKPWGPDWNNISDKYCIYFVSGDVWSKECQTRQCPFAFPTAEMRDAFYDNFKEEIEICKELL